MLDMWRYSSLHNLHDTYSPTKIYAGNCLNISVFWNETYHDDVRKTRAPKKQQNSIETNSYGTLKKLLRKKILIHTRYSSVIKIHAVIITIRLIISPCHKKGDRKVRKENSRWRVGDEISHELLKYRNFRLSLNKESVKNEKLGKSTCSIK